MPFLRTRGYSALPVHFLGKAATFNLLYAFPLLLLGDGTGTVAHAGRGLRLGVRVLGHRPLLVGGRALRLAGPQAARPDARPSDGDARCHAVSRCRSHVTPAAADQVLTQHSLDEDYDHVAPARDRPRRAGAASRSTRGGARRRGRGLRRCSWPRRRADRPHADTDELARVELVDQIERESAELADDRRTAPPSGRRQRRRRGRRCAPCARDQDELSRPRTTARGAHRLPPGRAARGADHRRRRRRTATADRRRARQGPRAARRRAVGGRRRGDRDQRPAAHRAAPRSATPARRSHVNSGRSRRRTPSGGRRPGHPAGALRRVHAPAPRGRSRDAASASSSRWHNDDELPLPAAGRRRCARPTRRRPRPRRQARRPTVIAALGLLRRRRPRADPPARRAALARALPADRGGRRARRGVRRPAGVPRRHLRRQGLRRLVREQRRDRGARSSSSATSSASAASCRPASSSSSASGSSPTSPRSGGTSSMPDAPSTPTVADAGRPERRARPAGSRAALAGRRAASGRGRAARRRSASPRSSRCAPTRPTTPTPAPRAADLIAAPRRPRRHVATGRGARSPSCEQTRDDLRSTHERRQAAARAGAGRSDDARHPGRHRAGPGPGVRITIERDRGEVQHRPLLDTVQELRDAGAEAMEFNDEVRVVAQTSFDGRRRRASRSTAAPSSAPYVIDAIGDPRHPGRGLDFPAASSTRSRTVGGTVEVQRARQRRGRPVDPQPATPAASPSPRRAE